MSTMQVDDLMRQAGLDAIADKDSRAAAGQEMTAPEQDRYDAIVYFAGLVAQAARVQALEMSINVGGQLPAEGHYWMSWKGGRWMMSEMWAGYICADDTRWVGPICAPERSGNAG